MAYIVMAYLVMAYIVMAYIGGDRRREPRHQEVQVLAIGRDGSAQRAGETGRPADEGPGEHRHAEGSLVVMALWSYGPMQLWPQAVMVTADPGSGDAHRR